MIMSIQLLSINTYKERKKRKKNTTSALAKFTAIQKAMMFGIQYVFIFLHI